MADARLTELYCTMNKCVGAAIFTTPTATIFTRVWFRLKRVEGKVVHLRHPRSINRRENVIVTPN